MYTNAGWPRTSFYLLINFKSEILYQLMSCAQQISRLPVISWLSSSTLIPCCLAQILAPSPTSTLKKGGNILLMFFSIIKTVKITDLNIFSHTAAGYHKYFKKKFRPENHYQPTKFGKNYLFFIVISNQWKFIWHNA